MEKEKKLALALTDNYRGKNKAIKAAQNKCVETIDHLPKFE